MRNIWTIAQKEYKHYFISPIAYAVAIAILLILGIIFYANLVYAMNVQYAPDITMILSPLTTILLFTLPALTMRTLSDEQKSGTIEILLTAPVRDWEVVVGKWLGGVLFILTLLAVTIFFPLVLNKIVQPGIVQGLMVSGYLGIFLLSCAFIAVGVMASSFFQNQIAAFFTALLLLLVLWMIGLPAQAMGPGATSDLLKFFDIAEHIYPTFFRGIIDLKDIVYLVSLTAVALFLGSAVIESRRWR